MKKYKKTKINTPKFLKKQSHVDLIYEGVRCYNRDINGYFASSNYSPELMYISNNGHNSSHITFNDKYKNFVYK